MGPLRLLFGVSSRSSGRRSGRSGSGPAPGRAMLRRDILTNFATSLELGPGSLGDGSRVSLTSLTVYGKWQQMRGQKFLQQIPMSLCPLGVEGMGARRARCLWLSGSALAGALPCWGKAHTGYASFGLGILSSDLPPDFESLRNSGPLQF